MSIKIGTNNDILFIGTKKIKSAYIGSLFIFKSILETVQEAQSIANKFNSYGGSTVFLVELYDYYIFQVINNDGYDTGSQIYVYKVSQKAYWYEKENQVPEVIACTDINEAINRVKFYIDHNTDYNSNCYDYDEFDNFNGYFTIRVSEKVMDPNKYFYNVNQKNGNVIAV